MRPYNLTVSEPDHRDPRTINWGPYQDRAVIAFVLDDDGRPVNPVESDLPEGQGGLWHLAEACAVDAVMFWFDGAGKRHLLMVERGDGGGWALPGGFLDEGEKLKEAVARELAEETGLKLDADGFDMLAGRYVPDPRAGRWAWVVSFPGIAVIDSVTMPVVAGDDDARQARWLPATTYDELAAAIAARGGKVYPAHIEMLGEVLS